MTFRDDAGVDAQLLAIFGPYDSAVAATDGHSLTASSSHCVSSNTCDRMDDQALLRAHSTMTDASTSPLPVAGPKMKSFLQDDFPQLALSEPKAAPKPKPPVPKMGRRGGGFVNQ